MYLPQVNLVSQRNTSGDRAAAEPAAVGAAPAELAAPEAEAPAEPAAAGAAPSEPAAPEAEGGEAEGGGGGLCGGANGIAAATSVRAGTPRVQALTRYGVEQPG